MNNIPEDILAKARSLVEETEMSEEERNELTRSHRYLPDYDSRMEPISGTHFVCLLITCQEGKNPVEVIKTKLEDSKYIISFQVVGSGALS